MAKKFTRIATKWAAIKPALIANTASPAHITSVISDMQASIAELNDMLIVSYLAMTAAEDFIAGFEDDDSQIGVATKLQMIRTALKKMESES